MAPNRDTSLLARMVATPSVILPLFLVCCAIALLLPGHLAITAHEIDVLHSADIALALAEGGMQHRDFMTPLGILATAPISLFIWLGFGVGTSLILANILMATLFLPLLVRVCPRIGPRAGTIFGVLILLLALSLVYGGETQVVSMSMSYNRWGWVAVMIATVMLLFPSKDNRSLDALILGGLLGFLALTKITYFVAFAPVVLAILLYDRDLRGIVLMGVSGLAVAALATVILGVDFWFAYLADLMAMTNTEIRSNPGMEFTDVVASPNFLPQSLLALAAVIMLRKAGAEREGFAVLVLFIAFAYILYQNWGNDPKWLIVFGFAMLVWGRRFAGKIVYGSDVRLSFAAMATVAFAIIAPSLINMALSIPRNLTADTGDFMPLMHDPAHDDLLIPVSRSFNVRFQHVDERIVAPDEEPEEPVIVAGAAVESCHSVSGYAGTVLNVSNRLQALGITGGKVAIADIASHLHMIGPFERVPGVPPWYYGGLRGYDQADLIVILRCPMGIRTSAPQMKALSEVSESWVEVASDPYFRVFRVKTD